MIKVHGLQQQKSQPSTSLNTSPTMVSIKPCDFQLPSSHVRARSLKDGIASGASLDKAQQSPAPKARTFTITPDNRKQKERATQKPEEIQEQSTSHTTPKLTLSSPMVVHSQAPSTAADDDGDEFFDCAETEEDLRKLQAQGPNSLGFSPIQTVYSHEPSLEIQTRDTLDNQTLASSNGSITNESLYEEDGLDRDNPLTNTNQRFEPSTPTSDMQSVPSKNTDWSKVHADKSQSIKKKAAADISIVHQLGHWGRDMRAIASQHYLVKQWKVWLPPVLLGLTSAAIGAAAIAGTAGVATPLVLGIGAALWGAYAVHVKNTTWPIRETNKNSFSKFFTDQYHQHKLSSFSANAGFAQYDHVASKRINFQLIDAANREIRHRKENQLSKVNQRYFKSEKENAIYQNMDMSLDSKSDFHIAKTILFGTKEKLSQTEITKFRQLLPDVITSYRDITFGKNPTPTPEAIAKDVKQNIFEKSNGQTDVDKILATKKYSEHLNRQKSVYTTGVLEATKNELNAFLAGHSDNNSYFDNNKSTFAGVDKILSIKEFKTVDDQDPFNNDKEQVRYRVFYAKKSQTQDSAQGRKEIEKHIERGIMTRGEILGAKHGTDSLQNLVVSMIYDDTTELKNTQIAQQLRQLFSEKFTEESRNIIQNKTRDRKAFHIEDMLDQFKKDYEENLKTKKTSNKSYQELYLFASNNYMNWLSPTENTDTQSRLGLIDAKANQAADESDYLLHESTACRNPYSTHESDDHGLAKAWNNSTGMLKEHTHGNQVQKEYSVVNLPFNQKLTGHGTHFSPIHQHEYLKTLTDGNLINYKAYDNISGYEKDTVSKLHKAAHKELQSSNGLMPNARSEHYYTSTELSSNKISEREYKAARDTNSNQYQKPSFGPLEDNNSTSIANAIKRFNSSRDLQIIMASLYKIEAENQPLEKFTIKDIDNKSELSWNKDRIFSDMSHAMNVSVMHNELSKLEGTISDLKHALENYSKKNKPFPANIVEKGRKEGYSYYLENQYGLLDTMMHQKEIKRLTAEATDSFHSLFKTQLDYQIAYSAVNSTFSKDQKEEMSNLFKTINSISSDKNIKAIFDNTTASVNKNRNRLTMNIFNGMKGRARLPFFKVLTFKSSIDKLLNGVAEGTNKWSKFDKALNLLTENRFNFEDTLFKNNDKTQTYKNLEYIEGLVI
ncbi:MAG TPA: hypothetical protein DDW29_15450 [Gammaproteobacteria bacterium]|nr:hypothetical protein [Gammaproteobacteria bacterium]